MEINVLYVTKTVEDTEYTAILAGPDLEDVVKQGLDMYGISEDLGEVMDQIEETGKAVIGPWCLETAYLDERVNLVLGMSIIENDEGWD